MSALLEIEGLGKTFGDTRVLRDVALKVEAGEGHALIGANGSGKSPLITILAGCRSADEGTVITFNGRRLETPYNAGDEVAAGMRFIHQDAPLVDSLSVIENLALEAGYTLGFGRGIRW